MNENKNKATYPLIGSFLIIVGLFLGLYLAKGNSTPSSDLVNKYGDKLANIIQVIDKNYVDSINKEQLFEESITRLLHELDPHSTYISAENLKLMSEGIEGKYGGVGIRFTINDDTLSVVNVIKDSPSSKVGVQKFDQIIAVDGENIAGVGLTNERVQELLKGKEGVPVNIIILRGDKQLKKQIIRGMVPITTISASFMLTDKIGYIRLSQFSMNSDMEFYKAALDLKTKGMEKLIFDLRHNGGGVLRSAVNIAGAFLQQGKLIVSVKGKNSPERILRSTNKPFLGNTEVAVLINSGSASASEIVAGALQDNDRGTIIGRRSFGKGLVQQDFKLKDGSDLRLTIARYYTPTGRSIQKPYGEGFKEYMMEEYHRYKEGEMYHRDSSLFVDSLRYITPKGDTVYGGGGIMPDIFIPLDTTGSSDYLRSLRFYRAFNTFAFEYVKQHRLNSYSTFQSFEENFIVTPSLLKQFTNFTYDEYGVIKNEKDYAHSINRIKTRLKSEIARQKWIEQGMFYVLNQEDKEVQKAVEILTK